MFTEKIPPETVHFFRQQAEQKIKTEGWVKQGRNGELKKENFVRCWITEEAFKQLLIKEGKWFRNRGLYFGDASGAGADFVVKIDGKEVSLGIRSISSDSLHKWKTVAYPDDRFQNEKEKIAEYHVVCCETEGDVSFLGIISKEELLIELERSARKYSLQNQEYFRVIPLEKFRRTLLKEMINRFEES